ncbi:MAG: response regulator [Betaproteobacteria bacterium]|nr:MAG: response regulator [Betaproteobacteria bacterium]
MIILVDDNADQRLVLRLALEQGGYSVREAANGRDAIALQRVRPAAVLITDIFMPEADGFELIDNLTREFPATRIVVVSGGGTRVTRDYLASAKLMGVEATLEKPFPAEALLKMLSAMAVQRSIE